MKLSVFYDHILQAAEQTGKNVPELLAEAKNAGIDAVEINMTYLNEHEETLEQLREAELRVSCVYEFYEMDKREEKERAKKHLETAQKAGAGKILVVPGFLSEEEARKMKECVPDAEKMAAFLNGNEKALRMRDGLAYIAEQGAKMGITVTMEDFDNEKSPISCVNGLLWFFGQIPQLRGTFDTGNFITHGEAVLTAWDSLKERIVHVHCKDRGDEAVAVGDGYIPVAAIVERLNEMQYDGYLAIEHFDAADQETCIRRSAEFLRSRNLCICQSGDHYRA